MADLEHLNLQEEEVGTIDFDAPEAGSGFPPKINPGVHTFTFKLEEEPWDEVEIGGKKFFQVNYQATDDHENTIRFQRASFFQTDAMKAKRMNSQLADMLRGLGYPAGSRITEENVKNFLREADGRTRMDAEVSWRRYCKTCDSTVSTSPRKKKGDHPWPKAADGSWEPYISCPTCGDRGFGREEIIRFKLPKA